jgi:hypothetical protein
MAKAKTHFEQIPLDAVRDIAEAEARKKDKTEVAIERSSVRTEPHSIAAGAGSVRKG